MEYLTIDDLKDKARKKVPKAFHDYVLSGSWTESTLKENSNDFKKISFRQRVAVDISNSCLLYTSPSPRDPKTSRMPSSA